MSLIFPQVELNIYDKNNPVIVPILSTETATTSSSPNIIRHITFDLRGTNLEGKFYAGQSIGILPPGMDEKGKPHTLRLYSISSPSSGEDGQGIHHSTTVKRVIGEHWENQQLFTGICSNYLSSLQKGDLVKVTGPSGKRFLLPENAEDYNYVFFATGTGVAPFRGMIKDLMAQNYTGRIVLIFGTPYRTDLLYENYFRELEQKNDSFTYIPTISREDPRPDGSRPYVQTQLIDRREMLRPILEQDNTLIYVCGLKGMETGIIQSLAAQKLDDYLIFRKHLNGNPYNWDPKEMKRAVKPGERMFLEVY